MERGLGRDGRGRQDQGSGGRCESFEKRWECVKYLFGRMGERTYWRSVVGLLGSFETPFEMCGHAFQLELVGTVDVALRIRSSEWKFLTHGRCSKTFTSCMREKTLRWRKLNQPIYFLPPFAIQRSGK